jgi:hypothetical protein
MWHPSAESQNKTQHIHLERLPPIPNLRGSSGSEVGHVACTSDDDVYFTDRLLGGCESAVESCLVCDVDGECQDLRATQGFEVFLRGAEDRGSAAEEDDCFGAGAHEGLGDCEADAGCAAWRVGLAVCFFREECSSSSRWIRGLGATHQ